MCVMQHGTAFVKLAEQHGFGAQAARATLTTMQARLVEAGYRASTTFYIYRTAPRTEIAGSEPGDTAPAAHTERPRYLLAFASPDDALAFAQHHRIKPVPRLMPASLSQLLIALLQQPAIQALLFASEHAPVSPLTHIPTALRLDRTELEELLKGSLE